MADGGRRLLVLCSQGGTGGTQRVAISAAAQMARRGWHTRLVFPEVPEGGDRAANAAVLRLAAAEGVPAEAHAAMLNRVAPRTLASMLALRALIRSERPDVVNLHYGWSEIPIRDVIAARLAGARRVVVSLHLPVPWEQAGGRARLRTRWAAALASAVVSCSDAVAGVVRQAGVPARRVHVIPGGVRPPTLPNVEVPLEVEAARAALGVPRDAFVVACIARMSPEKAQGDLLRAVARLGDHGAETHVVLQGDGPDLDGVRALAEATLPGRVHFVAGDADTARTYRAADLFALPSHAEGWPLVLMEAAGYGLPAVATAVGGVPDEVSDGATGLLVLPADPEALARAIDRVRTDAALRECLGAEAREVALREFHEDTMGDRYEAVYLGRGSGARATRSAGEDDPVTPRMDAAISSMGSRSK